MAHETVWQAFESHYKGRLEVSNRQYEKVPKTVDAAKEWFPPKAPARVLTSTIKLSPGIGGNPMKREPRPVHRQLNDAEAMQEFIRVLKEAEQRFKVLINPSAQFGQNETNGHPELRVFLHPSDVLQKPKWWRLWRKMGEPVGPEHAAETLDWVARMMNATALP